MEYISGTKYDFSLIHSNSLTGALIAYTPCRLRAVSELVESLHEGSPLQDVEAEKVFSRYKEKRSPKAQMVVLN